MFGADWCSLLNNYFDFRIMICEVIFKNDTFSWFNERIVIVNLF